VRNIFLSFHQEDEIEANVWSRRFAQYFNDIRTLGLDEFGDDFAKHINSSDGDYVMRQIREKAIAGTSCTVVLIGKCTWARRYVDWEIAATLRNFDDSARGGLIGVRLPSAKQHGWNRLPARLETNIATADGADTGYARLYAPAPSNGSVAEWVEAAVARRDSLEPVSGSTSDLMVNNRSCS
jgi:hypothetical protein